MKLKILLFLFLSQALISAQIDTTDWFPLKIGNYWEYAAIKINGPEYFGTTVIGDTLMPNGKVYKILKEKNINITGQRFTWYLRKDSNKVYRYYGDSSTCFDREYKYLDFLLPDSAVWEICRDLGPGVGNARGIAFTLYDNSYYNYLKKPLETKEFEDIYIDTLEKDTLWTPGDGSRPILVSKGIGIVRQFLFNDGDYWLQGAIINGVYLGTITSIEDKHKLPNDFTLYQNYPNPFNPSTNIKYYLPESGTVKLVIYNVLGQEMKILVNEFQNSGSYSISADLSNYSSGIYFYRITTVASTGTSTGSIQSSATLFSETRKMLLLK